MDSPNACLLLSNKEQVLLARGEGASGAGPSLLSMGTDRMCLL